MRTNGADSVISVSAYITCHLGLFLAANSKSEWQRKDSIQSDWSKLRMRVFAAPLNILQL